MKLIKNSILFLFLITIVSCGQSKKNAEKSGSTAKNVTDSIVKTTSDKTTTNNSIPFFKGKGEDSNWTAEFSGNEIKFSIKTERNEDFSFPLPEPIRVADANIKMYRAETESAQIKIQIAMRECTDSDSKTHPYTISIDFKHKSDTDFSSYKGCGEYIVDYRLHDIWVLESLNGKKVNREQFTEKVPNLEIYAEESRFLGYAGCNTMNGSIFSEQSLIRFTNIATTRKMCPPTNKETEFLKALKSTTHYTFENGRLQFSNPDGNTLRFIKVD